MFVKAFAQPNGGKSYVNAEGKRVKYTATSKQGRLYERTGVSNLGATKKTAGTPKKIKQVG